MPLFLDDQFARTGFILGSSAAPTGGTWSAVSTALGTADLLLDAGNLHFGTLGTPYFVKNSATPDSADYSSTFEFTPLADDWLAFALFRVSGSDSAYQIVVSSGGVTCYTRTSSDTFVGTQIGPTSTEVLIPASNRTSHTVVCGISGNTFYATVDGTPILFGGSAPTDGSNFLTAAGVAGIGGRSINSAYIQVSTAGGGGVSGQSSGSLGLTGSSTAGSPTGTLTLATPLCNNTGPVSGLWANQTGITLAVLSEATKASVLVVTGMATDANGVLTSAITSGAIVTGQSYRLVPSFGTNIGVSQVLTAT